MNPPERGELGFRSAWSHCGVMCGSALKRFVSPFLLAFLSPFLFSFPPFPCSLPLPFLPHCVRMGMRMRNVLVAMVGAHHHLIGGGMEDFGAPLAAHSSTPTPSNWASLLLAPAAKKPKQTKPKQPNKKIPIKVPYCCLSFKYLFKVQIKK